MTQWILCEECGKRHRETYPRLEPVVSVDGERYAGQLFAASSTGPAERGTMLRGITRYAMVCDHCDAALDRGAAAWAVGVIADTMQVTAPGWEREFIDHPGVEVDVPEWGTTVKLRPLRLGWNEER